MVDAGSTESEQGSETQDPEQETPAGGDLSSSHSSELVQPLRGLGSQS